MFGAGVGIPVARCWSRFELLHGREDGELDTGRADCFDGREPERILDPNEQRTDRDNAPTRGGKAVRGAGRGLAPQRSHVKPSTFGARDRVGEREQRRTGAAQVRDPKLDLGRAAGMHAKRCDLSGDLKSEPHEVHDGPRTRDEYEETKADHEELDDAERATRDT